VQQVDADWQQLLRRQQQVHDNELMIDRMMRCRPLNVSLSLEQA